MDDSQKDFAAELIKKYGEDRFYHSCLRTSNEFATAEMWLLLNRDAGLTIDENQNKCVNFLESIGIRNVGLPVGWEPVSDHAAEDLCRIAFGFCRWWREFGLKTHKLPTNIHARMVFGDNNEWVKNYISLLERYPEW